MKALLLLFVVLGVCAENSAQAKHCTWIKRREYLRYEFEKTVRERFSAQVNRKLQEFLNSLNEVERADIRNYAAPEADRKETLLELRRRLGDVADNFNSAHCRKGKPRDENGYPSKDLCVQSDGSVEYRRPDYYRGLRLYADATGIYLEGEIRQDSRRSLIRSRGDFYAGDYFVRITLGTPEDEKRQIASTAAEFNFIDFDDYLSGDTSVPLDCK